jgi:hypothetical protein
VKLGDAPRHAEPPEPVRLPAPAADPARESQSLSADTRASRWRDIWSWLGILAGTLVFVAALALPLDDPALQNAPGLDLAWYFHLAEDATMSAESRTGTGSTCPAAR